MVLNCRGLSALPSQTGRRSPVLGLCLACAQRRRSRWCRLDPRRLGRCCSPARSLRMTSGAAKGVGWTSPIGLGVAAASVPPAPTVLGPAGGLTAPVEPCAAMTVPMPDAGAILSGVSLTAGTPAPRARHRTDHFTILIACASRATRMPAATSATRGVRRRGGTPAATCRRAAVGPGRATQRVAASLVVGGVLRGGGKHLPLPRLRSSCAVRRTTASSPKSVASP